LGFDPVKLQDKLREIFGKVLKEQQGLFTSYIISSGKDPEAILCVAGVATPYIYGKIVLIADASSLDCNQLVYSPEGLYVFAWRPEEFVSKVKEKLEKMKARRLRENGKV
jgi:hypothetical protein